MLPTQTQRVLMLLALVLGTWALTAVTRGLGPADGLGGWTLADLQHPLPDAGRLLAGLVPALLLAGVLAATGNPLTALLTLGITLLLALGGGSVAGVLRRNPDPAATPWLRFAVELLGWGIATAVVWITLKATAPRLAARLPRRLRSLHAAAAAPPSATRRWISPIDAATLLLTAAVGGGLTWILMQGTSAAQATGSVILAFTIAALLGQSVAPARNPLAVLLAPALAGIAGYGYVAFTLGRPPGAAAGDPLAALYDGSLPGVARVLPLQFAAAGAVGTSVGLGVWQMMMWTKQQL